MTTMQNLTHMFNKCKPLYNKVAHTTLSELIKLNQQNTKMLNTSNKLAALRFLSKIDILSAGRSRWRNGLARLQQCSS